MTDVETVTYEAVDPVDDGQKFMSFLKLWNSEKQRFQVSTVYFMDGTMVGSKKKARDFWHVETAKQKARQDHMDKMTKIRLDKAKTKRKLNVD